MSYIPPAEHSTEFIEEHRRQQRRLMQQEYTYGPDIQFAGYPKKKHISMSSEVDGKLGNARIKYFFLIFLSYKTFYY